MFFFSHDYKTSQLGKHGTVQKTGYDRENEANRGLTLLPFRQSQEVI